MIIQAVNDYLNGKGSYETIAAKYGLRSDVPLTKWVKMYNNGEDFSHKKSGKSLAKQALKIVGENAKSTRNLAVRSRNSR